jgi:glycosyltransferase involved in cell wall biosynthesis
MGDCVPAASVVIVNYNYERYLREAIDSALDQGDSVEVIVVDDGSIDGSADIIRSYGDRVRPILQDNAGQGAAFNAGYGDTSGEVVCFLDADDLLLPSTMADALARYEAEPYAKLHWPLAEVDEGGRRLGGVNPPVELPSGDLTDLVAERGPGAYPTPPSSGNAYSRSFLEQVMPVPDELRVCADVYLYDLAPLYGPVARLDRPGGVIRFHDSSNFMARRYDDRLPHSVRVHELTIPKMAERCRRIGREPDEAAWRERSWPLRSQQALDEIDSVIPAGRPFVLIDGGRVGVEPTERRPLVRVPEDRTTLADLRQEPDLLVVAWPSFPWLDARADLRSWIERSYRSVLDTPRVRVYVRNGTS